MKTKIIAVLSAGLLILTTAACENPDTAVTSGTHSDTADYTVYPRNAELYIPGHETFVEAPKELYSTIASGNPYEGVRYQFYGEVTAYEAAADENGYCDAVTLETAFGPIQIVNRYKALALEHPEFDTEMMRETFALPAEGEFVCIDAEYRGFSLKAKMPFAFLGGETDTVGVYKNLIESGAMEKPEIIDFFLDEKRREWYEDLCISCQYRILYDVIQDYLANNEVRENDSAYSILEIIEPVMQFDSGWIVGLDEFDGGYAVTFPGAQDISEDCYIAPKLKQNNIEVKIGFIRDEWLFFDTYQISADGERVREGSVKSYDAVRDVLSGNNVREYAFITISDGPLKTIQDADKVVIRFQNKKSQQQVSHILTQAELDALCYAFQLRTTNIMLSDLLYNYQQNQEV